MCKFFSLTSDGKGSIKYMDWAVRKQILSGELQYDPDNHTSINDYFGYKGAAEDSRNKYEFNPLTGVFKIDQINGADDSVMVEQQVRQLDFSQIVPQLIIKTIAHPFQIDNTGLVIDDKHIDLLKKWASVGRTVWESVLDSVSESVWGSVLESVLDSVLASVLRLVSESFGESVWRSVWRSVRGSVKESCWAYVSSFAKIEKWRYIDHSPDVNPFQPLIDLWEMGIVPSFDGKTWRLHTNTGIVYEAENN